MSAREEQPTRNRPSWRLSAWIAGGTVTGVAGELSRPAIPESWRGNGQIWDIWAHVSNSYDSLLLVGAAVAISVAVQNSLRRKTSLRQACGTAAIGLACGLGMNAIAETPAIAHSAIMQEYFPHTTPDPGDELYGDTTSVVYAALLADAMRRKRSEYPAAVPMEITEIPQPPHSAHD